MEGRGNLPTQEQTGYINRGLQLGAEIEQSLGLKYASLVHPEYLALIGASVFAPDESIISSSNADNFVSEAITNFPDSLFQDIGCSRTELQQAHLRLIGYDPETKQTNYSNGEIANALRGAKEKVGEKRAEVLKRKFAGIMANLLKLNPRMLDSLSSPGIRVQMNSPLPNNVFLHSDGLFLMHIDQPNIVVEYGPGIVAFKKIPSEVRATQQTFFIENSLYACELLVAGANLYGIQTEDRPERAPQLVGTRDGIKSATQKLLNIGAENKIDLVIASGVHSAGREETVAGIINGHKLLRKGGIFVIRTIEENIYGISGKETFHLLRETFRKNPTTLKRMTTIQQTTGKINPAFCAVFTK